MDSLDSKTEEKIGLPPEMRSLDEDLDELIFNQAAASEDEGTRSCSKPDSVCSSSNYQREKNQTKIVFSHCYNALHCNEQCTLQCAMHLRMVVHL